MGSIPTPSEINSWNREFWANQDHIGRYGDAIAAATDALTKYDAYGHGRFAWLAYKSVRDAERLWPAYQEAMIAYVSSWGEGQKASLSTEVLDTLRERVLCVLDGVVADLLDLSDTSSKQGHAAIKQALRIDGENSPTSSKARALEEKIIERMIGIYRHVSALQEGFERGESSFSDPPPAAAQHIKRMVANSTGVSVSQVDATWRQYLFEGELSDYCSLSALMPARALKPNTANLRGSKSSPAATLRQT